MTQAVDFSKVRTKKYKVWRILQSPGAWAEVYREREKTFRRYPSGIIFPEQLLGLQQKSIYQVGVSKSDNSVRSFIRSIRNFMPRSIEGVELDTLEKILQYEIENDEKGDVHRIQVGGRQQDLTFYNYSYFAGQKDALKYQQAEQARFIHQIG